MALSEAEQRAAALDLKEERFYNRAKQLRDFTGPTLDKAGRAGGRAAKAVGSLSSKIGNVSGISSVKRRGENLTSFGQNASSRGLTSNPQGPGVQSFQRQTTAGDPFDTSEARRKYKSSLHAERLAKRLPDQLARRAGFNPEAQTGLGQEPRRFSSPEAQRAQQNIINTIPESNRPRGTREADPTTVDQMRAQLSNLKLQMARTKNKSAKEELEQLKNEQIDRLRKAVKRRAKAAFKRGVIYVVDLIAATLDFGTAGVSLIVDFFIYLFTFGWLNLELFYGKKFAKGKSKFISPLSWDPIPVPVDPNAVLLEGIIIATDIVILAAGLLIFGVGTCMILDYVAFQNSPLAFAWSVLQDPLNACTTGILTLVGS